MLPMSRGYVSGFFDADGSISMPRQRKDSKYRTLKIDFTNCDKGTLQAIKQFFDERGISSYLICKPARKPTHSDGYSLTISSPRHVIEACRLIESKHEKKAHRIGTVLKYHLAVTKRNGKYTEKEHRRRKAYERLFFR